MRRSKRSARISVYARSRTVWGFALIGVGTLVGVKWHDAGAYIQSAGYALAGLGVKAGLARAETPPRAQ